MSKKLTGMSCSGGGFEYFYGGAAGEDRSTTSAVVPAGARHVPAKSRAVLPDVHPWPTVSCRRHRRAPDDRRPGGRHRGRHDQRGPPGRGPQSGSRPRTRPSSTTVARRCSPASSTRTSTRTSRGRHVVRGDDGAQRRLSRRVGSPMPPARHCGSPASPRSAIWARADDTTFDLRRADELLAGSRGRPGC